MGQGTPDKDPAKVASVLLIGICLVCLSAILVYMLCAIWPNPVSDVQNKDQSKEAVDTADGNNEMDNAALGTQTKDQVEDKPALDQRVRLFGKTFDIGSETRLILIAVIVGALGSCIHVATSFASFVGNQRFEVSWIWWYILRLPIGISLALVFYFAIRAGFLFLSTARTSASDISPFGVAATAGLVGMFSKQASDKLREFFDNLFRTEEGDQRSGKLFDNLPTTGAEDQPSDDMENQSVADQGK